MVVFVAFLTPVPPRCISLDIIFTIGKIGSMSLMLCTIVNHFLCWFFFFLTLAYSISLDIIFTIGKDWVNESDVVYNS